MGLVAAGVLGAAPTTALDIVLSVPSVYDGDRIEHDGASLRVEGEVFGAGEIREITVNGQPAGMATRDLVVEGFEEEGTPFRGAVSLAGGENTVTVQAVDAGGATSTLSFTVFLDPTVMTGQVYALIVGVNDYQDQRISDLRFAEPDAKAMQQALTHPDYGIVEAQNVVVLTGADATYRNISRALEDHLVRKAKRAQDTVIFYFAGHGTEGPHVTRGAAYYLVPHDAELSNLLSTGIDKGRLQFLWGAIGAQRKIFITDACHSGGLQGMKVLSADGFEAVEGHVTLAAARADQLALELPSLGHGLFTYALTEGLAGKADADGDGFVSAEELGKHIRQQVMAMASEMGSEQEPVIELVPGAAATLVATSQGSPLPPWTPAPPKPAGPYSGMVRMEMRFDQNKREPHLILAMRDEEGDPGAEEVAETSIMERLIQMKAPFRIIEAAAVEGKLEGAQAELAFSEDPADIAAVARAVEADLFVTGSFRTEESGAGSDAMQELLGTTMNSYQAHLSTRVVYANSGEVVEAKTIQTAGTHINPTMARRRALEEACERLADGLRRTLKVKWARMMAERPSGLVVAEHVDDYEILSRLEAALAGLGPAVANVRWQSFEGGAAVFSFQADGDAAAVARRLREHGFGDFEVGGIQDQGATLAFWLK
jgi:hypothetical protein